MRQLDLGQLEDERAGEVRLLDVGLGAIEEAGMAVVIGEGLGAQPDFFRIDRQPEAAEAAGRIFPRAAFLARFGEAVGLADPPTRRCPAGCWSAGRRPVRFPRRSCQDCGSRPCVR
jgi:hypothetical protein